MRLTRWTGLLVVGLAIGLGAQGNRAMPVGQTTTIQNFSDTATLTVDAVTLNFMPPTGKPRAGKQFVRVQVSATNTSKGVYTLYYTSLKLQTSDMTRHGNTSSVNKGNSTDRLETTKLAAGASVTGAMYYEVSAKETRESMHLVYSGHIGTDEKDYLIPLTAAAGAPAVMPAPAAPAPAPAKAAQKPNAQMGAELSAALAQMGADLSAAIASSLAGTWVLDEAKSKAAPDGNTAGLMKEVVINEDGTFKALYGTTGKWKFDGMTLIVNYANSPGLDKKGGPVRGATDGEWWLKFPAPAGLGTFCYLKPKG